MLYGREENEVFSVWYRANTIETLTAYATMVGLQVEIMKENADPSYTSFDSLSYGVSKLFSSLPFSLFRPHIVGILKKE